MTEQVPFWWVVVAFVVPQVVALATVGLTQHLQAKREHHRWLMEHRAQAIEGTISHAWRVGNDDESFDLETVRANVGRLTTYGLRHISDMYLQYLYDSIDAREKQTGANPSLLPLIEEGNKALDIKPTVGNAQQP